MVGVGFNTNKTHTQQMKYNRFRSMDDSRVVAHKTHAEIACLHSIRHMRDKAAKMKLYIFRTRKDQDYGQCRPCPACMKAIQEFGIKDIYYTTDAGYAYEKIL